MKKVLYLLGAALLMLAVASCDKTDSDNTPAPYYKVSTDWKVSSGTISGNTDFSNIFSVTEKYINERYSSESAAIATYNDVLSKTKDVSYNAAGDSFVKLYIVKYVAKRESEHVVDYDADPTYKSPVGHIWDAKGSRDL